MYARCSMALGWAGWWRYIRVSLQLLAPAQAPGPRPLLDANSAVPSSNKAISAMRMGHCTSFPMRAVHCAHWDPFLPGLRSKSSFTFWGFVTWVETPLVLNRHLHCCLTSSRGKNHDIGLIILFPSLPALLTRIMLWYRDRKSAKMARAVSEAWRGWRRGEGRHGGEGSTRSSARGSGANYGSSLQGCSFSTKYKAV